MNRKNLLMWATAVLMVFMAVNGFAQEGKKVEKTIERRFEQKSVDAVGEYENDQYPKVVVSKEKISFYDAKGGIKKEKLLTKRNSIVKSKRGKAIGVWEALEIDANKDLVTREKFTVYDTEGNIIWEKEGIGESLVSDDGQTAVEFKSVLGDGSVSFYNSKGLIKKVYPSKNKKFRDGYAAFSDNGRYYAIITSWPTIAVLYDNNGTELWKHEFIEDRGYDINISATGNYIVLLVASTVEKKGVVYCFNK